MNIGLLRSLHLDKTESGVLKDEEDYRRSGIQLTWTGAKQVESPKGLAEKNHYVAFRFAVAPFVFQVEARDLKDLTTSFITVLTFCLSAMSVMRIVKTFSELELDRFLVWYSEKYNLPIPKDVARRIRILDEHMITGKPGRGQRRLSSLANVLAGVGQEGVGPEEIVVEQQQKENKKKIPKKKRRLSSREVIMQHSNPMPKKSTAQSAEIEMTAVEMTGVSNIEAKILQMKQQMEQQMEQRKKEMEEKMEQQKQGMEQMKKQMEQQKQAMEQQKQAMEQKMTTQKQEIDELRASIDETAVEILVDEESGRRYSYSNTTGVTEWLDDE